MKATITTAAALAAAFTLTAAPAHAQNVEVEVQQTELATSSGQAAVLDRFTKVARDVCKSQTHKTGTRTGFSQCTRNLLGELVDDLGHAGVTALHDAARF
jgi:UrcA family protein